MSTLQWFMMVLSSSLNLSLQHLPPTRLPVAEVLNQEQNQRYWEPVEGRLRAVNCLWSCFTTGQGEHCEQLCCGTLWGHPHHQGWLCPAHFQAEQRVAKDVGFPASLPGVNNNSNRAQPSPREERRGLMDQLRQDSREGDKKPSNTGSSQLS